MVDFRSSGVTRTSAGGYAVNYAASGVPSGGLGIFTATKSLSSPAASSLDKPAGTLSAKTSADIAQTGSAAQSLISSVSRTTPSAARSYAMSANMVTQDVFMAAQSDLLNKYLGQATPLQTASLIEAAQTADQGVQRSVTAALRKQEENKDLAGSGSSNWILLGIAALALMGAKL
jgi:hypothetical protein